MLAAQTIIGQSNVSFFASTKRKTVFIDFKAVFLQAILNVTLDLGGNANLRGKSPPKVSSELKLD
jgi:hypothetical protein